MRYTKRALILLLSEQTGIPKYKIRDMLAAIGTSLTLALKLNQRIYLPHLGLFYTYTKAARGGIHPITQEAILIASKRHPKFRAGQELKSTI